MISSLERKITLVFLCTLGLLILILVVSLLSLNQLMHTASEARVQLVFLEKVKQTITLTKTVIVAGNLLAVVGLLLVVFMFRKERQKPSVAEKKQLEADEWLKDIQQLAKIGTWEYTVTSKQLVLSEPLYELWEIEPNAQTTPTAEQLFAMIHPEDVEQVQQKFLSCIQRGEAYQTEYRVVGEQEKFFESIFKPEKKNGRVVKVRGTTQDITEHKLTEEALRKSEKRFASIFRLNPLPVAITRLSDGKIIEANDKALEVFGFARQEIAHATTLELNIWANPQDREVLLEKLKQQSTLQFEATYRKKDGKEWNTITSLEVIDLDQEQCMLLILQDITERKQAEEAIKAYSEQLEKMNASKDKFFSIIAHDLMSPVNGIMGSADILSSEIDHLNEEEVKTFSESIFTSVKHLKRLLSNLLEWARIHAGDIKYQPREVNLHSIASDVMILLHENAQKKGISLHNMLPDDFILQADENMLHSIVSNLVSNAIKFSPLGGSVQIEGKRLPGHLQLRVSDNGIGMSQLVQDQLFQLGSKHTTLGTAKEKGNGLGLLLCKEFAEKHEGSIAVESEQGKGTTFTITLPR